MQRFDLRLLLIPLLGLPLLVFTLERTATSADDPVARGFGPQSNAIGPDDRTAPASCLAKDLLFNYEQKRFGHTREVPIWRFPNGNAFFFASGMTIDADGAPNAYNADNTGLDDLANAGAPGHWEGILQDKDGNPLVQGPGDPFPGYYISCTSLADWSKPPNDPARYVDASKIPYIVLPGEMARQAGARPGDLAVVVNIENGSYSYAIFADVGTLGEGSVALANNLGISSDARHGGSWWGVLYLVFPGSGDHRPKSIDEIDQSAHQLLADRGGLEKLNACAKDTPRPARPPFARDERSGSR
ncbi:MAG: glycoside hydrolase family 75 protein [Candidatus Acidiferrales bacterium]